MMTAVVWEEGIDVPGWRVRAEDQNYQAKILDWLAAHDLPKLTVHVQVLADGDRMRVVADTCEIYPNGHIRVDRSGTPIHRTLTRSLLVPWPTP